MTVTQKHEAGEVPSSNPGESASGHKLSVSVPKYAGKTTPIVLSPSTPHIDAPSSFITRASSITASEISAVETPLTPPSQIDGRDASSDEFRMYSFKVLPCPQGELCPDWIRCPYSHPEEKATRRDPRLFNYRPQFCQGLRKNSCPNGDNCMFSHSVFEAWLHPHKYRTQWCQNGANCDREVCFFAHTDAELRSVPVGILEYDPQSKKQMKKPCPLPTRSRKGQGSKNVRSKSGFPAPPYITPDGRSHGDAKPSFPPHLLFPVAQAQQAISQSVVELLHARSLYEACSLNASFAAVNTEPVAAHALQSTIMNGVSPATMRIAAMNLSNDLHAAHSLVLHLLQEASAVSNRQSSSDISGDLPLGSRREFAPNGVESSQSQDYSPFMSPQLFDRLSLYSVQPDFGNL